MNQEVRQLIREMTRKGWEYRIRNGGHVQLTHPTGGFVITSASPSDRRANNNIRALIRRIDKQKEKV